MFLTQDWVTQDWGSGILQVRSTNFDPFCHVYMLLILYSSSHDGKKKKSLNSINFDIKYFPFKNIF